MIKLICSLALALTLCCGNLFAQASDPTLFTVADQPVSLSEFQYIYDKTNGDSATYTEKSLEEYLDLYVRFKLKVAAARSMGLDTVKALEQELNGYRRQLADSYLVDKEVTEPMARELYDRMKEDVRVFHIVVETPPFGQDTVKAYTKIKEAQRRLQRGENWANVASDISTDRSVKDNHGDVGFISAPLPEGLYQLETAIYETPTGVLSDIIRSKRGYHLVRVAERRPARGQMQAAHIFIRTEPGFESQAKSTIDSLYAALKSGANFEELARNHSDDKNSAPKGGDIGTFGINQYDRPIEDAAFGLNEDGDYSEPIESRVGWHIIKRLDKDEQHSFEDVKMRLTNDVKRKMRFQEGREDLINELLSRYRLTENKPVLETYIKSLPDTFTHYRWRPAPVDKAVLFTLNDSYIVYLSDFTDFLRKNSSQRIRLEDQVKTDEAARILYKSFLQDETYKFAESQLDKDNEAFSNLMREYREGILLFEATKQNVWDKAGTDTVGLKNYFAKHRDDYKWDKRVVIDVYSVDASRGEKFLQEVLKFGKKNGPEATLTRYNTPTDSLAVSHHEQVVEKGREPTIDALKWKRGNYTKIEEDKRRKLIRAGVIRQVLAPQRKELSEARGFVIADYQDQLEREWVKTLRAKYPVDIDRSTLLQLVK